MEKTILISIVAIALPSLIFADSFPNLSLEDFTAKIMDSQKVNKVSEIDCQKVSNEEFEQLGKAAMAVMHPDKSEHELMDQMMGGEGSDSLKAMHIIMGKRYLGCTSGMMGMNEGGGMMSGMSGMMSGMMGNWSSSLNQNLFNNMMGNFGAFAWFGWIFMVLFWLLIILGIVAIIKWLINQTKGENKRKSALDILEERYVKGEISKEEFEEKKKDLTS